MSAHQPHYVLYSQVHSHEQVPRWRVVLNADDGQCAFEASDIEPECRGERLELLAVVRGLEALDTPSRVTLVTNSRYVQRGLSNGLSEWRTNGWVWEWFGQMVPVKNVDLWQRLDRALKFHRLECRRWRIDPAHGRIDAPHDARTTNRSKSASHQPVEAMATGHAVSPPTEIPVKSRGNRTMRPKAGTINRPAATPAPSLAAGVARKWKAAGQALREFGENFREKAAALAK